MDSVHYLNEQHILLFLLQLFLLLFLAKILGEICRRRGVPSLAGEILAGILLGPTIFGRIWPDLHSALFPRDLIHQNMLETVSWLGVLFLLLATGFEVNLSTAWKQGRTSATIGTVGVVIPVMIGVAVFWWLPAHYWGPQANHITFTLLLAIAAAISAIPVLAKVLHDLEILKSDFGLETLSAFVINDILGWFLFTMVLGVALKTDTGIAQMSMVLVRIAIFGTICLTLGSRFIGWAIELMERHSMPQTASMLTLISCLALLCGAITQRLGFHAILGFFLAGIMAGNAAAVNERTREIITQMVFALFVPIFLASIGIKIDFLRQIDGPLTVIFTLVAIGGKFVGAWIGGLWSKLSGPDALSTGIAHIPGGAMEIVVGMLALELRLITETVFVAIVFAALSSSVLIGPLLAWSLRRRRPVDVGQFLVRQGIVANLAGTTRWQVIAELCQALPTEMTALEPTFLSEEVIARERIMGTALEKGLAVPHARPPGLARSLLVFGHSDCGIEWDSPDGLPVHDIFLILTPEDAPNAQVQILATVALSLADEKIRTAIHQGKTADEIYAQLKSALSAHSPRWRHHRCGRGR